MNIARCCVSRSTRRNLQKLLKVLLLWTVVTLMLYMYITPTLDDLDGDEQAPLIFIKSVIQSTTNQQPINNQSVARIIDRKHRPESIDKILAAIKPTSSIGAPNVHNIQSDNRDLDSNMQDYPSLTTAINFLYAEYHGYEYTRYQWLSPITNDTDTDVKDQLVCGRATSWCKIIAVFDALNNVKHNDWVLSVDSDAAFLNIDQSVEQYISTTDWRQNRHHASFMVSHDIPYSQSVCAGIWMVRNDEVGRAILADWWNCQRNEAGHCQSSFLRHPYEQGHFNGVILPTFTEHISIWKDYSFVEGKQKFWKHIGTYDKQHRMPRFTKLLDATVGFLEKKIRMTIDIDAVVEEVRHHHTLPLVDQSPTQIELEHL